MSLFVSVVLFFCSLILSSDAFLLSFLLSVPIVLCVTDSFPRFVCLSIRDLLQMFLTPQVVEFVTLPASQL